MTVAAPRIEYKTSGSSISEAGAPFMVNATPSKSHGIEKLVIYFESQLVTEPLPPIEDYYQGLEANLAPIDTDLKKALNLTSSEDARQQFEELFLSHREEVFEDGVESKFSRELVYLVRSYGEAAMEVLFDLILHEKVNAELVSEALRWLGQMEHLKTYQLRLWLLEQSLNHSSAQVRDGAALGLAFMDDTHAVPYLKKAIQQERNVELRADMEQVLEQLESA